MINSVFLGIDQIEIDDSFFSFFRLTKKVMKYINISKKWTFYQDQSYYSINDANPVIVFEIQLGESGVYNKRYAYNIYEVLALIGGMSEIIIVAMVFLTQLFGSSEVMAQVIENFCSTAQESK